MYKPLFIR